MEKKRLMGETRGPFHKKKRGPISQKEMKQKEKIKEACSHIYDAFDAPNQGEIQDYVYDLISWLHPTMWESEPAEGDEPVDTMSTSFSIGYVIGQLQDLDPVWYEEYVSIVRDVIKEKSVLHYFPHHKKSQKAA